MTQFYEEDIPITLTLPASTVLKLIAILSRAPHYEVVIELQAIAAQVQEQLRAHEAAQAAQRAAAVQLGVTQPAGDELTVSKVTH